MPKTVLLVKSELAKAHYDTFTRKDGSVVNAHDDKRAAAKPGLLSRAKAALGFKGKPAAPAGLTPEKRMEFAKGIVQDTAAPPTSVSREKNEQRFMLRSLALMIVNGKQLTENQTRIFDKMAVEASDKY